MEPMACKHPKRKEVIAKLTAAELETPREGLSREVFLDKLQEPKHDVAQLSSSELGNDLLPLWVFARHLLHDRRLLMVSQTI